MSPIFPKNYVGIAEASSVGFDSRSLVHQNRRNFARRRTPLWTGDDPVGISYTDSDTPAPVTLRPDIRKNPNLAGGQRNISR